MKCPQCGTDRSRVVTTRKEEEVKKRRRRCMSCGSKFWTIEKFINGTGYVYFVQARTTKLIKIGYSVAPHLRLDDLQSINGDHLTLLAYMRGNQTEERRLHKEFAKDRERGEWFRPSAEIYAAITKARQQAISSDVPQKSSSAH